MTGVGGRGWGGGVSLQGFKVKVAFNAAVKYRRCGRERETEPEYRESATRERLLGLRRRAETGRFEGAREQFPHAPATKDARCSLGSISFLSSFLQPLPQP